MRARIQEVQLYEANGNGNADVGADVDVESANALTVWRITTKPMMQARVLVLGGYKPTSRPSQRTYPSFDLILEA